MSSPLDHRMRAIAREEAAEAVRGAGASDPAALDAPSLQQQITDLHEHLHHAVTTISHLSGRVDALENAATLAVQEPTAGVRRTRRKTVDE